MSVHAQLEVGTGILVFSADPQSPWQRGTNSNGLLRLGDAEVHRVSQLDSATTNRRRRRPGPNRSHVPDQRKGQA